MGSTGFATAYNSSTNCYGVRTGNTVQAHRVGVVKGMRDVVTPGFKKRAQRGEVINSPMRSVTQTFEGGGLGNATDSAATCIPPSASVKYIDWEASQRIFNPGFVLNELRDSAGELTYPTPTIDVDALTSIAATRAAAGVNASSATGMLILAEMGKTIQFLANPFSALTRYLSRLPDMRRGRGRKGIESVAQQYLGYYYGLKPLMMDVEGVLDALIQVVPVDWKTSRGNASDSVTTSYTSETGGCSRYVNLYTYEEEVSVRSGILYEPSFTLAGTWGMRVSDIPSTVWEVVPFSFVVDWALNIGDFIAAVSALPGVKCLASWDVVRLRFVHRTETTSSYMTCPPTLQTRSGNEWVQRIIEVTLRTPKDPWKGVSVVRKPINFGTEKTLAAISLFTSLALGRMK